MSWKRALRGLLSAVMALVLILFLLALVVTVGVGVYSFTNNYICAIIVAIITFIFGALSAHDIIVSKF